MTTLIDGIVIGAAGGSIAGLTVWGVQYLHDKVTKYVDCNRLYNWLKANTDADKKKAKEFRSTRAIASWNNLSEDRVRLLCSIDERIHLNTASDDEIWSIYSNKYTPNVHI